MTKEDILRMAQEAEIKFKNDIFYSQFCDGIYEDDLMSLAELIAQHEREECAKVADAWVRAYEHLSKLIAENIRKRSKE